MAKELKLHIVDDSETSISKIKDLLKNNNQEFVISVSKNGQDAVKKLNSENFDCILLDYKLPDITGFEIIEKLSKNVIDNIPFILVTGVGNERVASQAIKLGFSDYIIKTELSSESLIHSINYSIEKKKMLLKLKKMKPMNVENYEARLIGILEDTVKTSVTARMFNNLLLKDTYPDIFKNFVEDFLNLLNLTVDNATFKVSHNISENTKILAEKLGFLRAFPRDVIEIYKEAIKIKKSEVKSDKKMKLYISESRMILIELMGYLAMYYRNFSFGFLAHYNKKED